MIDRARAGWATGDDAIKGMDMRARAGLGAGAAMELGNVKLVLTYLFPAKSVSNAFDSATSRPRFPFKSRGPPGSAPGHVVHDERGTLPWTGSLRRPTTLILLPFK